MFNCKIFSSAKNHKNLGGYKEVVIIGNGPCGLALSYYLSGHWPYWNGNRVQDEYFQMRLESCDNYCSLVEQDLEFLSNGLIGRSNNPISLLFDYLNHPEDEFGESLPTSIDWKYDPSREIDHLVIGKNAPGGSWNSFDPNQVSLSLAHWMELPNMSFKEYECRAKVNEVLNYYHEYVRAKNLEKYLMNNAVVTNVRRQNDNLWEISGTIECGKKRTKKIEFNFLCKYLIIASGIFEIPNELKVFGEQFPFVLKTTRDFEIKLKRDLAVLRCNPLLVVGCGLSAIECILLAQKYKIQIIHVIRRSVYDSNLIFKNLSKQSYPEYNLVYELMLKSKVSSMETGDYVLYDEHSIDSFESNNTCFIRSLKNSNLIKLKISYACVLIGTGSNLSYLSSSIRKNLTINPTKLINSRNNPVYVDPYTLETINFKNLFAMGPLVGDNFVRFGIGGALAITKSIWNDKQKSNDDLNEFILS